MTPDPYASPPRARSLRAIIIAMLLAFVCGLAAMAWALTHWSPAQTLLSNTSTAPVAATTAETETTNTVSPAASPPLSSAAPVTPAPAAPTMDDARVGALETRLAEIDRHAAASTAQAAHAEGILIAFAARRAIDRGVALGYLEGELNSHFGGTQPRAVANIIAASRNPITLDHLRAGLDAILPESDPMATHGDWWARLRANFTGLIQIRKAGENSTAPDERLARARVALTAGAVDNALAEIARLPGGSATNAWMANARRYLEAHNALDLLEAAAIIQAPANKPIATPPKPAQTPIPAQASPAPADAI